MRRQMSRRSFAVLLAAVLLTGSCTGGGPSTGGGSSSDSPTTAGSASGGTLRVGLVDFAAFHPGMADPKGRWNYILDPQVEYTFKDVFEIFRCCLLRTLFSYNGLSVDEGGTEARPDLAAGAPTVSGDGLTWTIPIRDDVRYAPPLDDREIVASDFIRALTRSYTLPPEDDRKALTYWLGFYGWTTRSYLGWNTGSYMRDVVAGVEDFLQGRSAAIAGLSAPDEHTLIIRLTRPTGDLPYRLSLPTTAPIPPGAADGHEDGYGRFLIASGPYMFEGSEALDPSAPPAAQRPVSGFEPPTYDRNWRTTSTGSITLIRNPSWDPAGDPLRSAYPDRIEFDTSGTVKGYIAEIGLGTLDLMLFGLGTRMPLLLTRTFSGEGGARMVQRSSGTVNYIPLNLAQPPFDDVHVRKAVNWAIDKEAIRRWSERRLRRPAATFGHVAPDELEGGLLTSFDPYGTPDDHGDLARARGEMARSRYDQDGDGVCDAPVCRGILGLRKPGAIAGSMAEVVAAGLRSIGIHVRFDVRGQPFWRPEEHVGLGVDSGWSTDLPTAANVFEPLFHSSRIGYDNGTSKLNPGLLGASHAQLARWGYPTDHVPNVDGQIDRCLGLIGSAQVECWAALDQYLMEVVVPWIPTVLYLDAWLFSRRVKGFSFDGLTGYPALDRIELDPSQPSA